MEKHDLSMIQAHLNQLREKRIMLQNEETEFQEKKQKCFDSLQLKEKAAFWIQAHWLGNIYIYIYIYIGRQQRDEFDKMRRKKGKGRGKGKGKKK